MKKKYIVVSIVVLLILLLIGLLVYKIVIEDGKKYEIVQVSEYNYFIVKHDNKYGVINKVGDILVEAEYDEVKIPNPEKDVFICSKNGNSKVLNENNEEILTKYDI